MTFSLTPGTSAPRQTSSLTCGSACLTVARMLADPTFARWINSGEGAPVDAPAASTERERFAAYERIVHRRTNSMHTGDDSWNLPWPRSLGTPPWGARKELEFGASAHGTRYQLRTWPRGACPDSARVRARFEHLTQVVKANQPALVYVGNRVSPRHIALVTPSRDGSALLLYDPHDGSVSALTLARCSGPACVAGWDRIWLTVEPTGHRVVPVNARAQRAEAHQGMRLPAQVRSAEPVGSGLGPGLSSGLGRLDEGDELHR